MATSRVRSKKGLAKALSRTNHQALTYIVKMPLKTIGNNISQPFKSPIKGFGGEVERATTSKLPLLLWERGRVLYVKLELLLLEDSLRNPVPTHVYLIFNTQPKNNMDMLFFSFYVEN